MAFTSLGKAMNSIIVAVVRKALLHFGAHRRKFVGHFRVELFQLAVQLVTVLVELGTQEIVVGLPAVETQILGLAC